MSKASSCFICNQQFAFNELNEHEKVCLENIQSNDVEYTKQASDEHTSVISSKPDSSSLSNHSASSGEGNEKKFVRCYICGTDVATYLKGIHEKSCKKNWESGLMNGDRKHSTLRADTFRSLSRSSSRSDINNDDMNPGTLRKSKSSTLIRRSTDNINSTSGDEFTKKSPRMSSSLKSRSVTNLSKTKDIDCNGYDSFTMKPAAGKSGSEVNLNHSSSNISIHNDDFKKDKIQMLGRTKSLQDMKTIGRTKSLQDIRRNNSGSPIDKKTSSLKTSSSANSPPQYIVCHLCGKLYSQHSISIHIKQCEKTLAEQKSMGTNVDYKIKSRSLVDLRKGKTNTPKTQKTIITRPSTASTKPVTKPSVSRPSSATPKTSRSSSITPKTSITRPSSATPKTSRSLSLTPKTPVTRPSSAGPKTSITRSSNSTVGSPTTRTLNTTPKKRPTSLYMYMKDRPPPTAGRVGSLKGSPYLSSSMSNIASVENNKKENPTATESIKNNLIGNLPTSDMIIGEPTKNSISPKVQTQNTSLSPGLQKCYLCSQMFGSRSLPIHQKQCLIKQERLREEESRVKKKKKPKADITLIPFGRSKYPENTTSNGYGIGSPSDQIMTSSRIFGEDSPSNNFSNDSNNRSKNGSCRSPVSPLETMMTCPNCGIQCEPFTIVLHQQICRKSSPLEDQSKMLAQSCPEIRIENTTNILKRDIFDDSKSTGDVIINTDILQRDIFDDSKSTGDLVSNTDILQRDIFDDSKSTKDVVSSTPILQRDGFDDSKSTKDVVTCDICDTEVLSADIIEHRTNCRVSTL